MSQKRVRKSWMGVSKRATSSTSTPTRWAGRGGTKDARRSNVLYDTMTATLRVLRFPLLLGLGFGWTACGGSIDRGAQGDMAAAGHGGGPHGNAGTAEVLIGGSAVDAGAAGELAAAGAADAGSGAVAGAPPGMGTGGEAGNCDYFEGDGETPENCSAMCGDVWVDFLSDWTNCGGCNVRCEVGAERCSFGYCIPEVCEDGLASCTRPGCRESTTVPDNCGACGVKAGPPIEHVVPLCGCSGECDVGVCAPGYANCDRASNDCETALATGGACSPQAAAPWCMPGGALNASHLALAPDGTLFIQSSFQIDSDFDPSSEVDLHQYSGTHGANTYVTKFNADGSYAWTRTWPTDTGAFLIEGLRAGSDGSLAIFGIVGTVGGTNTKVTYDLDPGPEVDPRAASDAALVKLDANGSYSWGRTWGAGARLSDVALDTSNRPYLVGWFNLGKLDADPGAGSKLLGGSGNLTDFLLSLDATGEFRWARSVANGRCDSEMTSVAVSGDSLWAGGQFRQCAGKTSPAIELPTSTNLFEWSSALLKTDLNGAVDRALPLVNYGVLNMAIGSTGSLYFSIGLSGEADLDPNAGVALRSGGSGGILAWSDDGVYRWVRADGGTINGKVSPGPDGGVLASSSNPTSLNGRITVLDSSGISIFTLDAPRKFVSSSATGFVVIGENKVACPQGLEVQPYTW